MVCTRLRSNGGLRVIVRAAGWLRLESPVGPEVLIRHVADENLDNAVHRGRIEQWIAAGEILQRGAENDLETLSGREDLGRTR